MKTEEENKTGCFSGGESQSSAGNPARKAGNFDTVKKTKLPTSNADTESHAAAAAAPVVLLRCTASYQHDRLAATARQSAVRALTPPIYPADYLRRVGHVDGPAVRGYIKRAGGGEKKDEIGRVTKVLRAAAVDQGDRSEMKKAGFFAASLAAAYLAAASSAALADASPDPQASSFSSKEVRLSSPSPPGS
ncbi:hypothetical protein GW17_00026242 [Ensete ventricosum]|nr:hypothetical protein GW17_00026242 [Ensete ventricosum]